LRGEKAAGCVGVWQHSTRAREDETRETPKLELPTATSVTTFAKSVQKPAIGSNRARRDGISARFSWCRTETATVFDRVSKFFADVARTERTARDPIQISGFSPLIGEIHGSQLKESKSAPHFLKIVRFRAFVGNP